MRAKRAAEGDFMSSRHVKVLAACVAVVSLAAFMVFLGFTDEADSSIYGPHAGAPVALSADGSILAVGAGNEASAATGIGGNQADNSAAAAGAVCMFKRSDTTWHQQAYVKASNTGANDSFGWSAALSADGSTLAVGATTEGSAALGINGNQADNSASNAGAVYVFR
jgi:hypothetical protein